MPASSSITGLCRDLLRQAWAHKWHALALPVGAVLVTALHESAHAIAVLVQGGEVLEWSVLPNGENWGYVRYQFAGDVHFDGRAISLAPYAMWLGLMAVTTVAAAWPVRWGFAAGSTWFVWGYVVPWLDIVNAWAPWLGGKDNDLMDAFGPAGWIAAAGLAVAATLVALVGLAVHRGLYRERAMSAGLYAVMVVAACVGAAAVLG